MCGDLVSTEKERSERSGTIFDVQPYALYDGPGIRTSIYFKGCPLRCFWCHNPESQTRSPQIVHFSDRCTGCGRCVKSCPSGVLNLKNNAIARNTEKCRVCGDCALTCPNRAHELIGFQITVRELSEQVARDKPFFDRSGGGVTLTGGEPTVQSAFLLSLARELRERGIHVALETCGYFDRELIEPLTENIDLFLFDLKHPDSEQHEEATGIDNSLIFENFASILRKVGPQRMIPRIPLIPDFNMSFSDLKGFRALFDEFGYSGPIHLMPYHGWAKGKYERLGRQEIDRVLPITDQERQQIIEFFSTDQFDPIWGG